LWVVELLGAEKMDNDRSNISSSASCFLSCWAYICFQKKIYKCPKHQFGLGFRVPHYELLCILRVRRTSKLSAPHVLENPKAHIKVHKTGIKLASNWHHPVAYLWPVIKFLNQVMGIVWWALWACLTAWRKRYETRTQSHEGSTE
jgi:hypothetical protein